MIQKRFGIFIFLFFLFEFASAGTCPTLSDFDGDINNAIVTLALKYKFSFDSFSSNPKYLGYDSIYPFPRYSTAELINENILLGTSYAGGVAFATDYESSYVSGSNYGSLWSDYVNSNILIKFSEVLPSYNLGCSVLADGNIKIRLAFGLTSGYNAQIFYKTFSDKSEFLGKEFDLNAFSCDSGSDSTWGCGSHDSIGDWKTGKIKFSGKSSCVDNDGDGVDGLSLVCQSGTDCDDKNNLIQKTIKKSRDKICCPSSVSPDRFLLDTGVSYEQPPIGGVSAFERCYFCPAPNTMVYATRSKGKDEFLETSICCPEETDSKLIIRKTGKPTCEECKSPNKLIYGEKNFEKGGVFETSICCPEGINSELIIRKTGNPTCEECRPPNKLVYGAKDYEKEGFFETSLCCDASISNPVLETDGMGFPLKCGSCFLKTHGNMVCKGDCSYCSDNNKIVKINIAEDCKSNIVKDCSEENKICVEHKLSPTSDLFAVCESCPNSLSFVTRRTDHMLSTSDGTSILTPSSGLRSENTFFSFITPAEVFLKISETCDKCPLSKINVFIKNHGEPGVQTFGDNSETYLNVDYLKNKVQGRYNFNCVNRVVFEGCSVGGKCSSNSREGEEFMQVAQNVFSQGENKVEVFASSENVRSDYLSLCESIEDNGCIVKLNPNGEFTYLRTIFYLAHENALYPAMPEFAYQTEITDGDLGLVKIKINSDDETLMLAEMNDYAMPCNYSVADSKEFIIDSETRTINFYDFIIEIPEETLEIGKTAKLKINKIQTNCTAENVFYSTAPPDKEEFDEVQQLYQEGYIDDELYNKIKLEFENQWECVEDEECYGACPMNLQDCSFECINHNCVPVPKKFIPETFCNSLDDNDNALIDEGCDDDFDSYYDSNMVCYEKFSSSKMQTQFEFNKKTNLTLNKGWNLVFVPTEKYISLFQLREKYKGQKEKQCIIESAWKYDPLNNSNMKVSSIGNSESYWVYSLNNCSFPLTDFNPIDKTKINLFQGYNLVPVFENKMSEFYKKISNENILIVDKNGNFLNFNPSFLNSVQAGFVFWNSQIQCGNKDCDDNNAEIGECK